MCLLGGLAGHLVIDSRPSVMTRMRIVSSCQIFNVDNEPFHARVENHIRYRSISTSVLDYFRFSSRDLFKF